MPNLCVTCTFNPPVIKIIGSTLRQETIDKLQQKLPAVTSTQMTKTAESKPPVFHYEKEPVHWWMEIENQFCDHLGRSLIYLAIIETLECEDWKLRASSCITHYDDGKDTNKFYFWRA